MKIINELAFDFDLRGPKVNASNKGAIVENVLKVILISDTSITVDTGSYYVTIRGENLEVGEIWEGRLELVGNIGGIEFYKT